MLWFQPLPSSCEVFDSTVRQSRARGSPRKGSSRQLPGFLISCLRLPQPHPFSQSHFLHFRQDLQSLQVNLSLPISNKHSPTCNSYQTCSEKKIKQIFYRSIIALWREQQRLEAGQENLINSEWVMSQQGLELISVIFQIRFLLKSKLCTFQISAHFIACGWFL